MKKVKYLLAIAIAATISLIAFAGCAYNKKVSVGKYYAEGSTESYIEILQDNTALFVNVDLTEVQKNHDGLGEEDINVIELTSVPVPYEVIKDHIFFSYHEWYALWAVYDFKNNTITFGDGLYCLQS